MNCSDINELTVDYLYGELEPARRKELEAHLAGCESCRRELEGVGGALGQARALLSSTVEPAPPSFAASRVNLTSMASALASEMAQVTGKVATTTATRSAPVRPFGAPVIPEDAGGFWGFLRRPWLVPAMAAAGVITLFLIAREAIVPPEHLHQEAAPVAAPVPPASPTPVAAPEGAAPALAKEARPLEADGDTPAARERTAPSKRAALLSDERGRADETEPRSTTVGDKAPRAEAKRRAITMRAAPTTSVPALEPTERQDIELAQEASAPADSEASARPQPARAPVAAAGAGIRAPAAGAGIRAPSSGYGAASSLAAPPAPQAAVLGGAASRRELDAMSEGTLSGSVGKQKVSSPRALIDLGARLYAEGRLADAAVVYQNLVQRYPSHPDLAQWKERLAHAQGVAATAAAESASGAAAPPAAAPAPAAAAPASPAAPPSRRARPAAKATAGQPGQ